jgi:hypothetical protein
MYTTVLPSGEITGLPAFFKLIHFSKEIEAFFWADKPDAKSKMGIRNVYRIMLD